MAKIPEPKKSWQFNIKLFDIENFNIQQVSPIIYRDNKWEDIRIEVIDTEDTAKKAFDIINMMAGYPIAGEKIIITITTPDGLEDVEKYEVTIKDMMVAFSSFDRGGNGENRTIIFEVKPFKVNFIK